MLYFQCFVQPASIWCTRIDCCHGSSPVVKKKTDTEQRSAYQGTAAWYGQHDVEHAQYENAKSCAWCKAQHVDAALGVQLSTWMLRSLLRGCCLVYSLARLSPAKAAADPARAGSSSSSSSKAAKEEEPVAAVAAARQGLLESLMPTTAAALPSYRYWLAGGVDGFVEGLVVGGWLE
eukprot:scaffold56549_cov21-Tisochrysis_lutea.AAC.2